MGRRLNIAIADLLVHLLTFVLLELKGRPVLEHFKDNTAEGPPVYCLSMAQLVDYFWCQILRRSTNRLGVVIALNIFLGEPEVRQLCVTVAANQNILRF